MLYNWAIIGAGPAGIAAVGKLLEAGVMAQDIVWIDPTFTVGDLGAKWRHVHSNTKVETFLKFLYACDSFGYASCKENFAINYHDPAKTCELSLMVSPLQWITAHLIYKKIQTVKDIAENLYLQNNKWQIILKNSQVVAKKVILAIGADPNQLAYPTPPILALSDALDKKWVKSECGEEDTIAVFGSSHSAVLALRNFVERPIKKVINFYRSPLLYALEMKDWILFDNEGLKGPAAAWAQKYLEGDTAENLLRAYSNEENIATYLPQCDKVVYAVGFERRGLPTVTGIGPLTYIKQVGIIAPGLFGVGIAFPEVGYNPLGRVETRVGLWKFMDFLQRVVPIWLHYPENNGSNVSSGSAFVPPPR